MLLSSVEGEEDVVDDADVRPPLGEGAGSTKTPLLVKMGVTREWSSCVLRRRGYWLAVGEQIKTRGVWWLRLRKKDMVGREKRKNERLFGGGVVWPVLCEEEESERAGSVGMERLPEMGEGAAVYERV